MSAHCTRCLCLHLAFILGMRVSIRDMIPTNDPEAVAKAALIILRGSLEAEQSARRWVFLPDGDELDDWSAVKHLANLPKPLFCKASAVSDVVRIDCSSTPDEFEAALKNEWAKMFDQHLSAPDIRNLLMAGFPLAIEGAGECLRISESDLRRVYASYFIPHSLGFQVGRCNGIAVVLLSISPPLRGVLEIMGP